MSDVGTPIERCLGDLDDFSARHWGRRPMLRRSTGGFDDLLSVDVVERLLVDLGRRPTFRLVRDGARVPTGEYTLRTRIGGESIDDVADVDRILDLVAGGATVVMQGLQRFWPPLAEFCLELEAELGHAVQANAYLSPPDAAGLAPHVDDHDVIVLHVAGAKRWQVDGLGDDVELTDGDVMYLPAGTRHAARTTHRLGLHITLGILTTTYRDVLVRMIRRLDDPELDRPLPIAYSRDGRRRDLRAGLERSTTTAKEAVEKVDIDALADHEVSRRLRRARRRRLGRLGVVIDPGALQLEDYIRGVGEQHEVVEDGTNAVLVATDRRLRMPAAFAPALGAVATRAYVRIDELPGLDDDERMLLVRRLLREGIVELA